MCFGFGRPICLGLHLAEASVWMSTVMSLAVFDISKVVENGIEIVPEVDPVAYLITSRANLDKHTSRHPKHFKYSTKPCSAKADALIQRLSGSSRPMIKSTVFRFSVPRLTPQAGFARSGYLRLLHKQLVTDFSY
ncbi:hypothetical protein EDB19DRAFT_1830563 [Suillus lakei]|nr:hypothetical protein EDB19DRAFT_1830563 [Suillus lakei]